MHETKQQPFLRLEGVTKRFGKVVALDNICLELMPDELLVVLGPTGAGKTTLLRTIAGLERPDAGAVHLGSADVTHAAPAQRDVALVFQNFALYPDWPVRKNLEFPLRAPGRDLAAEAVAERVQWAADLLRIAHLLDKEAVSLSGGEMQRVAIGRAIVRRPRLFLMDEPLSNLDAKLREALRTELAVLRRELGTPMIFVTHDQVEALSMGDRIVVLSEGHILQTGTPEEVYRRPASPLVARQLGQPPINLFEVRRVDGQWRTEDGTPIMQAEPGQDATAVLGIRPEDIAPTGGGVEGRVQVVENMGATEILLAAWAGQEIHMIVPSGSGFRPGDAVYPAPDAARAVTWPAA
ncbi:MAG TPA: ABC transporter ATP-binding protein [Candidatus Hydrogenedentes bacterium]|nr:ABC transporter ATP-binding protein [Candidatus Hydrogenedentota bacterium]